MQNTQHTTDTPRTQQTRLTPLTQHPLLCFTQQCLTQQRAQWMTTQRTHLQAPTRQMFLWPFWEHSHLRPLQWQAHLQQRAQWIRICITCCHPLNTSSSRFLYGTSTCCPAHHGAQCSRRHLLWFTQYLISVRVRGQSTSCHLHSTRSRGQVLNPCCVGLGPQSAWLEFDSTRQSGLFSIVFLGQCGVTRRASP